MARKLTAEERAALKAALKDAEGEESLQAAIAKMAPSDRKLAKRIHAVVKKAAPELKPKTWYGMPAWADENGKAVIYFRDAAKFKERYALLGFQDTSNLDAGAMWPVAYALTTKLTKADEAKIAKLVKQAVSS